MPTSLKAFLLITLGLYLLVCGYVFLHQRQMLYQPGFTRVPAAQTNFSLDQSGHRLRGWVVQPGRRKALIYFGGNAESIELNRADFVQWFPDRTIYLLAYRGYGASDGEPQRDALLADALALHSHVSEHHVGIALLGRSLGTGIATHVASQRSIEKLGLITPYARMSDPAAWHFPWLPVHWLLTEQYDSLEWSAQVKCPVLIVRAARDEVIPASSTLRLIEAFGNQAQTIHLDGAGHNDVDLHPAFGQGLRQFFR